jgi:hypothetical protein
MDYRTELCIPEAYQKWLALGIGPRMVLKQHQMQVIPSFYRSPALIRAQTGLNLASCSKEFKTSALGILMNDYAHDGNVTPLPKDVHTFVLQTNVQDILPGDWQLMVERASRKATFRDILSHQSGLPG